MADDDTRVMLAVADLRGDLREALAEITGELKVLRAQNGSLEEKVDSLGTKVKQLTDAEPTYVSKQDVDRKLRNSTAVLGVCLAVLTLLLNTIPSLSV